MKKLNSAAFHEYVENDGETCLVIFSRKSCHVRKNTRHSFPGLLRILTYMMW